MSKVVFYVEKNSRKEKIKAIKEQLSDYSNDEIYNLWNIYHCTTGMGDWIFYNDEDFFDCCFETREEVAWTIKRTGKMIGTGGCYNLNDEFIIKLDSGEVMTFNDILKVISLDELSEYIVNHFNDFRYDVEFEITG